MWQICVRIASELRQTKGWRSFECVPGMLVDASRGTVGWIIIREEEGGACTDFFER